MRIGFVATALFASCLACGSAPARPNVLLLVMDTTRGDRCSFMGYGRSTTPNLEKFAKDAVVFTDAWSPAGWTGPAHACLFTGLRCENNGFHGDNQLRLSETIPSLPEILMNAGYATACFTNNGFLAPEFGLVRGFDKFEPLYTDALRPYPWAEATHELAASWAQEQARARLPFFLYVNDMEPHMPYSPPEADERQFLSGPATSAEISTARAFQFPGSARYTAGAEELSPRQLGLLSDLYDGEVAALDREIGRLLDRLGALALLDSTIVVVAGDHGEPLGDHHILEHGYNIHRDARHVPLLVRFPQMFDGGRTVRSVVRLEDLMPTIFELCGLPVPADLDGASLTRNLEGRVARAMHRGGRHALERLEGAAPGFDVKRFEAPVDAVYDGRFHFLSYGDGRKELYDVARDPAEAENLAEKAPGEVARLAELLRASK